MEKRTKTARKVMEKRTGFCSRADFADETLKGTEKCDDSAISERKSVMSCLGRDGSFFVFSSNNL